MPLARRKMRSTSSSSAVNAAVLEPEDDVRRARHRPDFDLLRPADQPRRHARVHRVGQLSVVLVKGLDHRRGVHAGRGAERVAAEHRIVVGNRLAGRLGHGAARDRSDASGRARSIP